MPRRIFPSLRRRRIRIDTIEMRLMISGLTGSLENSIAATGLEKLYVELPSVILSTLIIRNCSTYVNSYIGKNLKKARKNSLRT